MVARGLRRRLTTLDSQATRGCPSILRKGVLRSFNGGTGQSPPKVVPTGPVPSSNQGLADPALILPLLQCLGLPEEVLEAVRARIATQKAPKKVSRGKQLSLLRAMIDVLAQQITRLNKTVLYHQEEMRENEDALSTKQSEHAQLQVEFRDLMDKGFTPTLLRFRRLRSRIMGERKERLAMKKVFQTFLWNTLLVVLGRLVMLLGRLQELQKKEAVSWVGGCSQ